MTFGHIIDKLLYRKPKEIGMIDVKDEVPEATLISNNLYKVNAAGFFEKVVNSDIPSIVDFYAEWCAPCNHMAPILKRIAPEYDGVIKFLKIDLDESPEVASHFKINAIPTLMLIKDGMIIRTMVGYTDEKKIRRSIDKILIEEY
ncbi:MAG: thioredoxin [Methanosarcinaceae archaeon]|nr:thioredoxin [Methanosarcinaceae archaeon]